MTLLFRQHSEIKEFVMPDDIKFSHRVVVDTNVTNKDTRFGICQQHIANFIQSLKDVEIEGRKVRTKYQIPMATGAPQAENFLWTILGNKVKRCFCCLAV